MKTATVSFVVLAALFAGCSDPPSGTIVGDASSIPVDGIAKIDYQPAVNPVNDTSGGLINQCPPPEAPTAQCTPAKSSIHVHLNSAPDPGPAGYTLWGIGVSAPVQLGTVAANGTGYSFQHSEDADMTGRFDELELRIGDFTVARASAQEGPSNPFEVPPANLATTVEGTFTGPDLTLQVANLPNGTFQGYLYYDENGALVREATGFPVANGEVKHTAGRDIGQYKELHIHAGSSMVNIYKATIAQG